ncbi:terpenoid synthase [Xylaria sp. FL0043]|nr:terpenoid synthase [Xylaria sp. FL0043]
MATTVLNTTLIPGSGTSPSKIGTREDLVACLRGCHVRIPDLQSLFTHWPQYIHPQTDKLEEHVQKSLKAILPKPEEENRLAKMKLGEFALFTASWWAYAPFEVLCVAATLSIWLFIWDDEIDSSEFSSLIDDFDSASKFRQETIEFLRSSLSTQLPPDSSTLCDNPIIKGFKPVGDALKASYNERQLNTVFKEIAFFVNMCEEEHKTQVKAALPTVEEYMKRRMGSSAVRICLAIHEYATGVTIPDEIMQSDLMERIWHEINIIISTVNDVLSIKKELANSQADTLIPLLFLESKSAQTAVDEAVLMISRSIARLEATESEMMDSYSASSETQDMLRVYIEACKIACTGNLNWSLLSGRYQIHCTSTANGLEVVL